MALLLPKRIRYGSFCAVAVYIAAIQIRSNAAHRIRFVLSSSMEVSFLNIFQFYIFYRAMPAGENKMNMATISNSRPAKYQWRFFHGTTLIDELCLSENGSAKGIYFPIASIMDTVIRNRIASTCR